MGFVHRMLKEPDSYLSIVYYDLPPPVLIYFTRTRAYFLDVREISSAVFFEAKRLPHEIESVILIRRRICVKTPDNHVIYYELTRNFEFVEVVCVYLDDRWCHYQQTLHVFRDAVAFGESKCIRVISGEGKTTAVPAKNSIVDVKCVGNFIGTLELYKHSISFNIYEVCVDVTLHRTMLEVDDTSYLLTLSKGGFCVFFEKGFTVIKNGKVHKVVPMESRVVCHFFNANRDDLFVCTSDERMLVIDGFGNVENLINVGSTRFIFMSNNYLLTLGVTNKIYRTSVMRSKYPTFVNEVKKHSIASLGTELKEIKYFRELGNENFCVYKTFGDNMSCRIKKARLADKMIDPAVKSTHQIKSHPQKPRIFVEGRYAVIVRGMDITHFRVFDDKTELVGHEDAQNIQYILFYDTSYIRISDNDHAKGPFWKCGDLYLTYVENTICFYSIVAGILVFVDTRTFNFKIEDLCLFGVFLILRHGTTLRIFNHKLSAFVFVQVLQSKIEGVFVVDSFLYVLTDECVISIYKLDERTGHAELPIKVNLGEKIWKTRNGVVYGEKHLYVFVKYDFVAMRISKDVVDALFCGNKLYVCSEESLDVFSIVFEPDCVQIFDAAHGKDQGKNCEKSLKYDVYSSTYIHTTHTPDTANPNLRQGTDLNTFCDHSLCKLVISDAKSGSIVDLFHGTMLLNRREFDMKVKFAISIGGAVICAFKFHCAVFMRGKKQLVGKTKVKFCSEITDLKAHGHSIFVVTKLHSIFKYKLVDNKLSLICSDIVFRKIHYFKIVTESLIVFCDMSGFVGILKEREGNYEVVMCVCTGRAVTECVVLPSSIVYRTEDGEVSELFCVNDRVFSVLDSVLRNLLSSSFVERRTLYPIVNVFPSNLELRGLVADNRKILEKVQNIQSSDVCSLLKILYGNSA
jgi:hypothetical protein